MIKDGKLWVHALEDCVVSACQPTCEFWGKYLCRSEKSRAPSTSRNYMRDMKSLDFVGGVLLAEETGLRTIQGPSPLQVVGVHDALG